MKISSKRAKPEILESQPYNKKKLRSDIARRRRNQISPVPPSNLKSSGKNSDFSSFSVDSSSCSCFGVEVSCNLSGDYGESERKAKSNLKKRQFSEIDSSRNLIDRNEKFSDQPLRRITRSYYRQMESERKEERKEVGVSEAEASESSYVESNSCVGVELHGKRSSKFKSKNDIAKEIGVNEGSKAVSRSEISCVEQISGDVLSEIWKSNAGCDNESTKVKAEDDVSVPSGVECSSKAKSKSIGSLTENEFEVSENRALEFAFQYNPINDVDACFTVSNSDSITEQWPKRFGFDSNLACTEKFSYEDIAEYSSSQAFSELQSEIFQENSDPEFSDSNLSIFLDSGSEFSERSFGDSTPSPIYTLLIQYRDEFSRSATPLDARAASLLEEEYKDHSSFLSFENEENEESYQMLRKRERQQIILCDYAGEYCSGTDCGDLILQQRSQMVHWIVEQSTDLELHQETMFLGVALLDKFLSKGFFKNRRFFQILGIACLTLATRLEENQPYNSVRRKNFFVDSNTYYRREVVAMEWLVEEVLEFRCFLPTVYNFLWFYLKAARADSSVEKKTNCMSILVLSDRVLMRYQPSTVAAALVILASLESNQDASHQRVMETHVRTKSDDLPECIELVEVSDRCYTNLSRV